MRVFWHYLLLVTPAMVGCAAANSPVDMLPIAPESLRVGATLRLRIDVDNPAGVALDYRVEPVLAGVLPGFETVHAIAGTPAGAEFRWTPLVSHVGLHELTFSALHQGHVEDSERVIVEVLPAADSAPVFVQPAAGATFDLARTPCVEFPLEVRDADSAEVALGPRAPLPAGAELTRVGPKSADFRWCPSSDQVSASQRWTLRFEAEDESHEPVPHDFVVVLRVASPAEGCPGGSPTVDVLSPEDGARVSSAEVRVRASDDEGLREAPLLYWSTEVPDDPSSPDVTTFFQVVLRAVGTATDEYVGRVALSLDPEEERTVFYFISAVDNDDPAGALCDHRTDGPLRTVTLVGDAEPLNLPDCDLCTRSDDCASGVCSASAGGAVCLPSCASCTSGVCGMFSAVEGALVRACGDAEAACAPPALCPEDAFEPNDTLSGATVTGLGRWSGGAGRAGGLAICEGAGDYFRYDATFGDLVTFRVDSFSHAAGDLDLRILDGAGTILATSESTTDRETASHCARSDESVYGHVYGFASATGPYDVVVERVSDGCCVDDGFEPDDAVAAARVDGSPIRGALCPGDDDYYTIFADRPVTLTVEVAHDRGDIDIELIAPDGVTVIGRASGGSLTERLVQDVTGGGLYTLRLFTDGAEATAYTGTLTIEERLRCTATRECATGDVCDAAVCRDGACVDHAECPASHLCAPGVCNASCRVNTDCRSTEACKRSFVGRVCGRRGSGRNGDPCEDFTDCGGQRECTARSRGGFCARVGCARDADCETGTFCVGDSSLSLCVVGCVPGDCRVTDGFRCTVVPTIEGSLESVCWPS